MPCNQCYGELTFHPHVHAIVSAGALSPDGAWLETRKDDSFPVRVMARLLREALLKAIDAGELGVVAEPQADVRGALFETKWHFYAKAPFGGAEQVYSYHDGVGTLLAMHADPALADTPVIMMTALREALPKERSLYQAALLKPFREQQLFAAIESLLGPVGG